MAITLDEKLSESATTCVYRAHDDTLGREVLLKVLHRHLTHDDRVRERFIREARACAALRSENIVQIYDLREHDGSPAIIMEYVDGRSLKDVIAEGSQRTFQFTEKVAVHVLRGLATAHAQRIIHRDIKPGNILVSTAGTIKIADFGLAQVSVSPTLTAEGAIVGTPAYLAPELLRGETADARTDLFSLGATLAETLSGKQLFEGSTYSDCLNRISRFKPEDLDSYGVQSSPEFVEFLKKLMHPDRNKRYDTPRDALAALGKLGSGEFTLPKSAAASRKVPWRIVASTVLIVALAFLGGYFIVKGGGLSRRLESPTTLPEPESLVLPNPGPADSAKKAAVTSTDSGRHVADVHRTPEQPGAVSARPDSGSILLKSSAGVRVHIDSVFVGELPLPQPVRLVAGPHTVVFTHSTLGPAVRPVQVKPGETISVSADFLAQAAYLRCTSVPWAEISVDDQYRDTTPIDRAIMVPSGKHRLRFHHPAFRDSVWDVALAPRETLRVSVNFKP
jgi:serine/threonine protein kinase